MAAPGPLSTSGLVRRAGSRLLYLVAVLFGVALLTFLIASLLPGDLAYMVLGDQATPETLAALRHDLGLDRPLAIRFLYWLAQVLQGDLGRSFRTGQTVMAAIGERLPVSIELMLMAEFGALAVAIPLAIACAVKPAGLFDRLVTSAAFGSLSMPSILTAILLIWGVAVKLEWLPATGYVPWDEDPVGNIRSLILPALTLALAEWPVQMRVLRSDLLSTLRQDYITMARAKGLKPARILLLHALKPSSLTLVTITGINIARLLGGTVIVEYIFALPGMGRLLIGSILNRDLILLQGVVLFIGAAFVGVNFAVDMLYAVLDPRIRSGHR
jgi:peptide/nickel transport system permease protein